MKDLLTGYVITAMALSLTESLGSIIHSLADLAVYSINLKTAQKQLEINKLAAQQEGETGNTKAIGFVTEFEEDEEEDDY